jgi:site-specific DNA recombinase
MIAAIYARKSTQQDGVADDAKSVVRQVDGARAFIARQAGWTLDDRHIYTDDRVSGALFANRAEFSRLMRDAAAGAFGAVVFFDIDRFGRDGRKTMEALNTLADLGVEAWDYSTGQQVDLNSFEGETLTFLKARFAQQYREQVRKHTREAMRRKAEQSRVTGGTVFGYDNRRIGKGHVERTINPDEAKVVREIYERFAAGDGARTIAKTLNDRRVPAPRAQQGRTSGWSSSTIRAVLTRPLYRGEVVYGRSAKAYGRELRTVYRDTTREKGQIKRPEETWLRRENSALRIIDPDLARRVDARYHDRRTRYLAAVATKGGRVPQRAHGKYLLSGGLLICPTCGGHFEARTTPWKGKSAGYYMCATRRRKPGCCANTLTLPIDDTDDLVLTVLEGQVLGSDAVRDLLALVEQRPDPTVHRQWRSNKRAHSCTGLMRSAAVR